MAIAGPPGMSRGSISAVVALVPQHAPLPVIRIPAGACANAGSGRVLQSRRAGPCKLTFIAVVRVARVDWVRQGLALPLQMQARGVQFWTWSSSFYCGAYQSASDEERRGAVRAIRQPARSDRLGRW